MPITLYESGAKEKTKQSAASGGVYVGTVVNNCDPARQGKVLVRIPVLDQEIWARMAGIGGGPDAGFFYTPRVDDEVLVGLNQNDPNDGFILGGLWNTQDSPPVSSPLEVTTKRTIKTGLKAGTGHEVEFDDGPGQSVTITTSTKQKITMDLKKIELSNAAGTVKITMDTVQQSVTIEAVNTIELKAMQIKLNATTIDVQAKGTIGLNATGACTISGKLVKIN